MLIVNHYLSALFDIPIVVNRREMVGMVDTNNCKHFPELKTLWNCLCPGNSHFNIIVSVAIAIAGSESEKLTISQSDNAIDLDSTISLMNPFPDRFSSLALGFGSS